MWKELIWLDFKCEMPFSYQARMKEKKMHQERERRQEVCALLIWTLKLGSTKIGQTFANFKYCKDFIFFFFLRTIKI